MPVCPTKENCHEAVFLSLGASPPLPLATVYRSSGYLPVPRRSPTQQGVAMFLSGFGPLILAGSWVTLKLSLLSLLLSMLIGLAGASSRLSKARLLRGWATAYTTLIRSVPDLVLMLLLFYSLQLGLNQCTEALGMAQIDIDPFLAGVVTLAFIYGAYFTETFRGAFLSVPAGQLEAAIAYGMTPWQSFRRVLFPQMMRFALPGIANNWQVLVKATALVSIIGLADIVKATQDAGKATMQMFLFAVVGALMYLLITTVSNLVLIWLENHYSAGVRKAVL
jgi:histidine transport system permease protein